MEPSLGIPFHFSTELLAVTVLGSLLAWAASVRRYPLAGAAALAFAGLIAHGGQFVADGDAATVVNWLVAAGGAGALFAAGRVADFSLWVGSWTAFAGSRLGLAVLEPHTALELSGGEVALHAVSAAGAAGLGVWVWRRTVASVRLRIIGAFVLILLVVVTGGGGAVVGVVAERIQDEEIQAVETDARAERTVLRAASEDLLSRGALVGQTMGAIVVSGGDPSGAARDILAKVFTDLAFIAVFSADRSLLGQSGLGSAEAGALSASLALTTALDGQPAPSLEEIPGALLSVGANPIFRPGAPPSTENIFAAVMLGRRVDSTTLAQTASERDLEAALVNPRTGQVIASSGGGIAGIELAAQARRALTDGRVWSGVLPGSDGTLFAAAAPLERADASVPAAIVLGSPDTALERTTLGVTRALFAGVLVATLVAVALALWLGSRIARPIIDLTGVAQRVEEGDLDAQPPDSTSEDEIGTLARTFSAMTASLRSTIAAERDTRQRLETIVGGMGEALIAVDTDFNVVSFNPAAEQVCGVSAEDALGQKCYDVYGTSTAGPDGQPICDFMCPLRHGGGREGEISMTRGRRQLAVAVTCSTLHDEDGNVVGGVDLLRDVTPEVEAERMKSNFLANVSHELRTPLTPIRGYAQILQRKRMPREVEVEQLAEIVENATRLERIVKILTSVAAMEAGSFMLAPQQADPGSLIRETAERWNDKTAMHEVKSVVGRGVGEILADRRALNEALDELLDNAVKFSPDGGKIEVRVKQVPRGVEISVTDQGIGIDREEQKTLFQPFVQGDPSSTRRFGGLGVGLYFVRRVVEGHGGTLTVASKPGKGSVFRVVLPGADVPSSPRAAKRASRGGRRPGSSPKNDARRPRRTRRVARRADS